MFSSPKTRVVITILGLVLLGVVIWYGGPYLAFGDYHPLQSVRARLVTVFLIAAAAVVRKFWKQLRANRASDQLMAAVVAQSNKDQAKPTAEIVKLRERFEEATATLKKQRRAGHSLYDLPWFVIIGAPGSGKTTALLNSGLTFPVKQRSGGVALGGVGGTRDCDWWFTDDAVFLDTAGRYTTQDSDAGTDSAGWDEFLALLRKYRERRPVNGVLLTISVQDLMTQSHGELEAHVAAARRRLDELNQKLNIELPVYVLVTKCDMVRGFAEYFDDLTREDRSQVWGVTFPYERTIAGEAAESFSAEFETLIVRLNARVFARLEEEHDVRRRATTFAFPQQMGSLRDVLAGFVGDVFGSTRFDRKVLLRGVYLTSGTQEGTPIDRLMGAIGRQFAVARQAAGGVAGEGKAYFIERLLKKVVFAESGLAGVNRRVELRKAAWQVGAYIGMAVIAVVGVTAFSISSVLNRDYVADVGALVPRLQEVPTPDVTLTPEAVLPRLDAVRAIYQSANQYRGSTPWNRRWGLYQGASLGNSARDAYVRVLDGLLLPQVATRIEQRLSQEQEPELLYEYLKAYLMLANPDRLDKAQLRGIAELEWSTGVPDVANRLGQHFGSLLELEDTLRVMSLDESLVARARSSIQGASIPELMFRQLSHAYAGDSDGALRLDLAAGIGSDQVLRRKSGIPLAQPISSLFSAEVFIELTSRETDRLVAEFNDDQWVWGDADLSLGNRTELGNDLIEVYERHYISEWDAIISDIALVPAQTRTQTEDLLARLGSPTSPLRALLLMIDENTFLTPPDEAESTPGLTGRLEGLLERARGAAGLPEDAEPGAAVTEHFEPFHQLATGDLGNLDNVLNQLQLIQQQLIRIGTQAGRIPPGDPSYPTVVNQIREQVRELKRSADLLPPEIGQVIAGLADRANGAAGGSLAPMLRSAYRGEVVAVCQTVMGRYPFAAGSTTDVSLNEFGRVFGHGGVYDRFFNQQLETLVDRSRSPWRWRPNSGLGREREMLNRFEEADRIRDLFFSPGGSLPELRFTVTLVELDDPIDRFVLEVDGQPMDYLRGSVRSSAPMMWPGPSPGRTAITFDTSRTEYLGDWSWFKMVDAARAQRETGTRYVLSAESGRSSARMRVDTESIRNPFEGVQRLRRFSCGS